MNDEDIASSDTTINGQQGPMTRARAHQLNYQVKSFLANNSTSPQYWMLLKSCDDYLILRNDGEYEDGCGTTDGGGIKIGHQASLRGGPCSNTPLFQLTPKPAASTPSM